jgi:hypothetical protein
MTSYSQPTLSFHYNHFLDENRSILSDDRILNFLPVSLACPCPCLVPRYPRFKSPSFCRPLRCKRAALLCVLQVGADAFVEQGRCSSQHESPASPLWMRKLSG